MSSDFSKKFQKTVAYCVAFMYNKEVKRAVGKNALPTEKVAPNMEIGQRIKQLRRAQKMTLEELARRLGTTKQTVSRYEKGIISIYLDRIPVIAEALGVSPSLLLDLDGEAPTGLPLLTGLTPSGEPCFEPSSLLCADAEADFCLYAHGEGMTGGRVFEGDLIYLCRAQQVENGALAAVTTGDGVLLRRIYQNPEHRQVILKSEDPRIAPEVYVGRAREQVRVLGRAVAFYGRIE